jgi:hypothetical protein
VHLLHGHLHPHLINATIHDNKFPLATTLVGLLFNLATVLCSKILVGRNRLPSSHFKEFD